MPRRAANALRLWKCVPRALVVADDQCPVLRRKALQAVHEAFDARLVGRGGQGGPLHGGGHGAPLAHQPPPVLEQEILRHAVSVGMDARDGFAVLEPACHTVERFVGRHFRPGRPPSSRSSG